jgi:hypothetical protein
MLKSKITLCLTAACAVALFTADTARAAFTFLGGASTANARHFVRETTAPPTIPLTIQGISPTYGAGSYVQTQPLLSNPGPSPSTTTGRAAVGQYTTATRAMLAWGSSVGVNQVDPYNANAYNSEMSINFNYLWKVDFTQAGPPISLQYSVPLAGSIGNNGYVRADVGADWYYYPPGSSTPTKLNGWTSSYTVTGAAQSFFKVLAAPATSIPFNSFPTGSILQFQGYANFFANNEESPSSIAIDLGSRLEGDPLSQYRDGVEYLAGFDFDEQVPEPASLSLVGALGVGLMVRRKR